MMKSSVSIQTLSVSLAAALLCSAATYQSGSVSKSLAPMPEGVTSFGAVTSDGWLYAFGGHKGERHEYSAERVSGAFWRINLAEGRTWEQLPAAKPGQGQPLVA